MCQTPPHRRLLLLMPALLPHLCWAYPLSAGDAWDLAPAPEAPLQPNATQRDAKGIGMCEETSASFNCFSSLASPCMGIWL